MRGGNERSRLREGVEQNSIVSQKVETFRPLVFEFTGKTLHCALQVSAKQAYWGHRPWLTLLASALASQADAMALKWSALPALLLTSGWYVLTSFK